MFSCFDTERDNWGKRREKGKREGGGKKKKKKKKSISLGFLSYVYFDSHDKPASKQAESQVVDERHRDS